jgi:cellulose synthase/poly-beta-1,6-N-acetylglucosamine synthase-like glycosyltransferase
MAADMSDEQPSVWSVGVVIPAQNEEKTIAKCVASVLAAHAHCGRSAPLWIAVVADSCNYSTVEIASRVIGGFGEVIECSSRSPGTARRLGVAAVMDHFRTTHPIRIWLANTDADTHVPRDWLRRHLDHADDDASAVAGIVQLDASEALRVDIVRLYDETYELRADGTHGHVHGANLGVRADAYLDAGGWSHVTVAEDHCLWRRLRLRGWSLRSCVDSVVMTSARLHGRAVGGFADTLRRRLEPEHG